MDNRRSKGKVSTLTTSTLHTLYLLIEHRTHIPFVWMPEAGPSTSGPLAAAGPSSHPESESHWESVPDWAVHYSNCKHGEARGSHFSPGYQQKGFPVKPRMSPLLNRLRGRILKIWKKISVAYHKENQEDPLPTKIIKSEASLSFIALWVVFSYRTYTPFTWISKAGPSQPGPSEIKEGVENLNDT